VNLSFQQAVLVNIIRNHGREGVIARDLVGPLTWDLETTRRIIRQLVSKGAIRSLRLDNTWIRVGRGEALYVLTIEFKALLGQDNALTRPAFHRPRH